MSISVMTLIWKLSSCKGSELLLLLAIADNANDDGYAYPGIEHLARKIRMKPRSVIRLTNKLEESGELTVDRSKKNNSYQIIIGDKLSPITSDIQDSIGDTPRVTGDKDDTLTINNHQIIEPSVKDSNKSSPSKKETGAFQGLFDAIMKATALDPKIRGNAKRIGKLAKELLEAGYDGSMVEAGYTGRTSWWFTQDWRGTKGSLPSLQQIKETIGQATKNYHSDYTQPTVEELQAQVAEAKAKVSRDE